MKPWRVIFLIFMVAVPVWGQIVPVNLAAQQHGAAGGGILVVQSTSKSCTAATSCALAFTSNVTAGDMLVYIVGVTTGTPTATTDNNSNTITNAMTYTNNGQERVDFVSASHSGATTVTANSSTGDIHIHIWEVSGVNAVFDQKGTVGQTGTALTVSTAGATTSANEIVFGIFYDQGSSNTFTAGSGFSPLVTSNATSDFMASEARVVSSTGTQTATGTAGTSAPFDNIVVTFYNTVTFDNVCSAGSIQTATSVSCNLTIGSTVGNGAVVIGLSQYAKTSSGYACTVGGVSASVVAGTPSSGSANTASEIFGLATGSTTGTVSVSCSWTTGNSVVLGATSYAGVSQSAPFAHGTTSFNASGTSPTSLAITSASFDQTFSVTDALNNNVLSAATQTQKYLTNDGSFNNSGGGQIAAGAATVTHQYTITGSTGWTMSGVDIVHR